MKIICFGDSNTWGFDPREPLGSRYEKPWPVMLSEKINVTVVNSGENGREIPVNPVAFSDDADLLVIMLGTNDLLQFWTPEMAADKMEKFLRSINGKQILLVAPPYMKFGAWVQEQELIDDSKALATYYRSLAQRLGIRFADAGKWNVQLAFDGVHMTQEGHRAFAECLCNYLVKENII